MNIAKKVANLESMVLVHYTIVLEHVIKIRASCFNTDFISQMKLTMFPLIYRFDIMKSPKKFFFTLF